MAYGPRHRPPRHGNCDAQTALAPDRTRHDPTHYPATAPDERRPLRRHVSQWEIALLFGAAFVGARVVLYLALRLA